MLLSVLHESTRSLFGTLIKQTSSRLYKKLRNEPEQSVVKEEREYQMPISVKDLLEAGCHFGHQTKRWNPKMKEFVYGSKNGISIIDLTKTIHQIADACNFLQRVVMNGGNILFVGTKRQAQQIVKDAAEATNMNYVSER